MTHTAVTLTPWMTEHLAKGHDAKGAVAANWDIPTLAGAGALRSNLNDMMKFAGAHLETGGRLQRVLHSPHAVRASARQPVLSIGMNWIHRRVSDQQEIVWHNGGTGGYRTWLGFDKQRRIAAVVLTNSEHGADDLGFELLK